MGNLYLLVVDVCKSCTAIIYHTIQTHEHTYTQNQTQPHAIKHTSTHIHKTKHNHAQPHAIKHSHTSSPVQPTTTLHNHAKPYTILHNHAQPNISFYVWLCVVANATYTYSSLWRGLLAYTLKCN